MASSGKTCNGVFGLLLLTLFAFNASTAFAQDHKIGIIVPQTGDEKSEGIHTLRAAQLAVKEVNDAGGVNGKKINLIVMDSKSTPEGSLESFRLLIDKEKVEAVIAPIKSAQIIGLIPMIKANKVPTFIGGTAVRLTQDSDRWAFRMRPDDSIVSTAMMKFVKEELKLNKIGILNDTSAFGSGGGNYVAKAAADTGVTVVKRIQFEAKDQQNYKKYLTEMKDAGVDAIVLYMAGAKLVGAFQIAYKEVGRPFKFVGSPANATKLTIETSKDASEGVYAIGDMIYGDTDYAKKFYSAYRAEFKADPDSIYSFSYDSIRLFASALKSNPKNSEQLREAVLATKNTESLLGMINFDSYGNGIHEVNVAEIKGGKPVHIKTVRAK